MPRIGADYILMSVPDVKTDTNHAAALFGLGSVVRLRSLFSQGGKAISTAMLSWLLIAGLGYWFVLLIPH